MLSLHILLLLLDSGFS